MHTNPTPPESDLALLLKQGTDYAESAMRKLGHVPPALFALTPQGGLQFVPNSLEDERAKNDFANKARLVCAGYEGRAALLVLESWMKVVPPGQPHDPDELPSEALDRHEIVMLMGNAPQHFSLPQRGCGLAWCGDGHNPVGVDEFARRFPKVARASQPWAGGRSPVGANFAEARA